MIARTLLLPPWKRFGSFYHEVQDKTMVSVSHVHSISDSVPIRRIPTTCTNHKPQDVRNEHDEMCYYKGKNGMV